MYIFPKLAFTHIRNKKNKSNNNKKVVFSTELKELFWFQSLNVLLMCASDRICNVEIGGIQV
jgi:hypothetical protein